MERYTGEFLVKAACEVAGCNFTEEKIRIVDTESTNNGDELFVILYQVEKTVPFAPNLSDEEKAEITQQNKEKFAGLPNILKEGLLAVNAAHREHLHEKADVWHGFVGGVEITPQKQELGVPLARPPLRAVAGGRKR